MDILPFLLVKFPICMKTMTADNSKIHIKQHEKITKAIDVLKEKYDIIFQLMLML